MLNALSTILYILLFLICLSVLIIVHELGHLTAAKVFKVYCLEFSCGMGPLIWKHKKKNGETQFSLRAIPFGGYVSMYGEGVELPEGVVVDDSRCLHNIKKWKQAIIIVAGVTMNAILAFFLFLLSNTAFEQQKFEFINKIAVAENSVCETAGMVDGNILSYDKEWKDEGTLLLPHKGTITFQDDSSCETAIVITPVQSFKNPVYTYTFFGVEDGQIKTTISYTENIKSVYINMETKVGDELTDHFVTISFNEEGQMEDCGLRIFINRFRYSFGDAVKQSFSDWGHSATAIFDSLKMLFTGEASVNELSGIVGIGFEAKGILDSLGVSTFIYLWGLISVNLAIINLLPFPGLDGWQLLVIIIEGITRKKFPEKVKNIVSFIGIALLLILMAFILFKDIWVYIIKGFVSGIVL